MPCAHLAATCYALYRWAGSFGIAAFPEDAHTVEELITFSDSALMRAKQLGGNNFQQTASSGVAQVSVPGSTNHGTLQGGAVENSNVDLTSELVNLITAQRNYQANAQTIKTQQTVDQTLINL